eukprot:Em0020g510a
MQIDVGGCLLLDKTEVEVQQLVNVYWDFSNYTYVPNSKDFIGVLEVDYTTAVNFCYFRCDGVLLLKSPPLLVINPEFQSVIQSELVPSLAQNIEPIRIEVYGLYLMALPSDLLKIEVRQLTLTFTLEKRHQSDSATGTITLSVRNWQLDPAPEDHNQLAPEGHNQLVPEGASLVHSLRTAGQEMGSPLSAPANLSPILASDGRLDMDTAVSSSPGEPQGGPSNGDLPHNNEGAAPAIIVTIILRSTDRQNALDAARSKSTSETIQRHASLLRSGSRHVRDSRRSFKQGQGLSPSHAAAIAEKAAEGQENNSAAAQSGQENVYTEESDQTLQRLFEFLDTPLNVEANEPLEPKGEPVLRMERLQSIDDELRSTPGFKFITRPDLYQYAQKVQNNALMSNPEAIRLVQAIRSDHSVYATFQHKEALVAILNSFAHTDWSLPSGWEKKIDPKTKKVVFIDHNAHLTTFIDPRLPYAGNEGQAGSEVATRAPSEIQMRTRAVVSTAPPAPSSHAASPASLPEANLRKLRAAIRSIREDGAVALQNYQQSSAEVSVQLASLLSVFDEEISLCASNTQQSSIASISTAIDFFRGSDCDTLMETLSMSNTLPEYRAVLEVLNNQSRILSEATPRQDETPMLQTNPAQNSMDSQNVQFQTKLQSLQAYYSTDNRVTITVRRDHILADDFRNVMHLSSGILQAHRFKVQWAGELGIDAGGPSREFFFKLSHQIFNPYYGLFQYSSQGSYSVEISPFSSQINDALKWFQFAGRVIGYAIIQGQLLDVFFARHFYKAILNIPFSLSDVEGIDVSFYNSLVYLQENDPEDLQLTFSVEEECFGEIVETDFKKGGSKISVTENNKKEYIKLMVNWRLSRGVQEQMEALVNGIWELVPLQLLIPFDARELEWVIAGTPEINFEDWKANTEYSSGYDANHTVIKWFWEVVASYSNEQKLKLLQCLVAIAGFVSCIKYGTQCAETSTSLAETQSLALFLQSEYKCLKNDDSS